MLVAWRKEYQRLAIGAVAHVVGLVALIFAVLRASKDFRRQRGEPLFLSTGDERFLEIEEQERGTELERGPRKERLVAIIVVSAEPAGCQPKFTDFLLS